MQERVRITATGSYHKNRLNVSALCLADKKVSMKRRREESTMAEKMKCEYCEKDAIGYQGFGCCSAYVCLVHADNFVLALKPGEKLASGECYFERF
jgi:hypothetical protein